MHKHDAVDARQPRKITRRPRVQAQDIGTKAPTSAITDDVLTAVGLARGIEGRMLPAPDQATTEHAVALLNYAALIEKGESPR